MCRLILMGVIALIMVAASDVIAQDGGVEQEEEVAQDGWVEQDSGVAQDAGVAPDNEATQDPEIPQDDGGDFDFDSFERDAVSGPLSGETMVSNTGESSETVSAHGTGGSGGVAIHGSYENQLTGMLLNSYSGGQEPVLYDANRLRLDLEVDLVGGIQLRADGIARIVVGETSFALQDVIPRRTLDNLIAADPRFAPYLSEQYRFENDYYVDNVYVRIPIGQASLVLGKQPLEQGAGYAWNPTDVFTDKDMFDPTYEKPGVISARAIIPLGPTASLDLIGVPDGSVDRWTGGGRLSVRFGPLSLSGVGFYTRYGMTDLEGSMDEMAAAAVAGEDPNEAIARADVWRTLVGGDAILDVAGIRLWAEGAYNFLGEDEAVDEWWELCGGFEYFFPFETHVMVEYFHYGLGARQNGGTYGFNDWMRTLDGDTKMLGRDFLFESIDHPIADYWTLGISSFQSISDGSAAIMADVTWDFAQDAQLWFVVSAALGDDEDMLSSSKGQSWLRLKVFF